MTAHVVLQGRTAMSVSRRKRGNLGLDMVRISKHTWPLVLAASIVLTLPFVFLRRLVSGDLQGVGYKVRGWLDGLRDREVPLAALGLR